LDIEDKRQSNGDRQLLPDTRLLLLPIGCGDGPRLTALASNLSRTAGITVTIAPSEAVDPRSYNAVRGQHRADALLAQARRAAAGRVLAITDLDLYMPGLNFVFGMAEGHAAVVSARRLRAGADAALLGQRLFKEALHEIGHSFGLGHCDDRRCVMSFSNSLLEADRKGPRFCSACHGRLNGHRRR
jgi:archaemetzincin